MTGYRYVKYCSLCKKRFLAAKGESSKRYCDECQAKYNAAKEKESEEEE